MVDAHVVRAAADALLTASVVVVGPVGSGRSWLARAIKESVEDTYPRIRSVHGGDEVAGVPLTPFAPLVDDLGIGSRGDDDSNLTLATYVHLPRELARESSLVAVDDADLLSQPSSVLLGHLHRAGVRLLVVAEREERLPDALRDGLAHGAVHRVTVGSCSPETIVTLARSIAGDHLTAGSAADLLARAEGRPGLAVALVEAGLPRSVATPGGLELGWVTPVPPAVRAWSIDPGSWDTDRLVAAQMVAVAGCLPSAAAGAHPGLGRLLAAGHLRDDGRWLSFARRLDADVVLATLSDALRADRAARAHDLLVELCGHAAPRSVVAAVRAGRPLDPTVGAAAAESDDLSATERADVLAALPDGWARTHLLRGAAASLDECLDEAEREFGRALRLLETDPGDPADPADPAERAARDADLLRLGGEIGVLHAVRRGDPAAAIDAVRSIAERLAPAMRTDLDADLVKWRLMAGDEAVAADHDARAQVDGATTVGGAVIGAMIASLDGTRDEVEQQVRLGLDALTTTQVAPPHSASLLRLSQLLGLMFDGDLGTAEEVVVERRDTAALHADPALGMWEFAAAEMALHLGRLDRASALSGRAVRHLAWRDFTGLRSTAVALQAAADARTGRPPAGEALAHLDRSDVKVDLHLARFEVDTGTRPAADLAAVAERAIAEMHTNLGLLALDEAWMLSRRPALGERLCSLLDGRPGALWQVLTRRTEAALRRSGFELDAVAEELAAVGVLGRAADAHDLAAEAHRTAGRRAAAAEAERRATTLRARHGLGGWPRPVVQLSAREREVAQLAAQRVRSREIGERLGLSARTVDNHLARVYRKLGIAGRDELVDLLGAGSHAEPDAEEG